MTKTDTNRLLSYILEILEMMVESGAEIYRVEESAMRICKAYGVGRADIFATTSNIIISVESNDGVIKTHTRRIGQIGTNIEKVHALNNLVRKLCSEQPELTQIADEIKKIKEPPCEPFCIITLIPLVPGGAMYYTTTYALSGNQELFLSKAIYTLQLAVALSLGIVIVTAASKNIFKNHKRNQE